MHLNSLVISPAQREIALSAILCKLIDILVVAECVEDSIDLRVGVAITNHLDRSTTNAKTIQYFTSESTGHHLSADGGSADVAVAGVVLAIEIMCHAEVIVQINVEKVSD